jgi:NAD(P)-dependent dehydrogenase (short-subunit alcohol dehydrogenase family)
MTRSDTQNGGGEMNLARKVAIVTGASRGLGRQIALELSRRGATVVVAARTVAERRTLKGTIFETVDLIKAAGGQAIAVPCDVAEADDVRRLVEEAVAEYGRLDIVVNNAADMVGQELEPMVERMLGRDDADPAPAGDVSSELDSWTRQFAINVHAPFLLMTLAAPHMRAQGGGVIVNISSDAADLVPASGLASLLAAKRTAANPSLGYAVTKAALNRMTNRAAADLAPDNIAVIAVSPGPIKTELADTMSARGVIDSTTEFAPMSEVAELVADAVFTGDPMDRSGQIIPTRG